MKKINCFWGLPVFLLFCLVGCSTAPEIPYSFAENNREAARVSFVSNRNIGIKLIDYNGTMFPAPDKGTVWEPVLFPAGKTLHLYVNVFDTGASTTGGLYPFMDMILLLEALRMKVNRNVYFVCPALQAGNEYQIVFRSRSIRRDSIVLKEKNTGRIIHEQKL